MDDLDCGIFRTIQRQASELDVLLDGCEVELRKGGTS